MKTLIEDLKEQYQGVCQGFTELSERIAFLKDLPVDKRGITKDVIDSCQKNLDVLAVRKKEFEAVLNSAGQVEELLKAGLEPVEPFTAEFLSMMLSLGISRLTMEQRYALVDGLLVRLPERPNCWKQRCLLAEKCMEESPSDPDITTAQIEAHKEYNEFLSNQTNPEG